MGEAFCDAQETWEDAMLDLKLVLSLVRDLIKEPDIALLLRPCATTAVNIGEGAVDVKATEADAVIDEAEAPAEDVATCAFWLALSWTTVVLSCTCRIADEVRRALNTRLYGRHSLVAPGKELGRILAGALDTQTRGARSCPLLDQSRCLARE